MGKDYYEILEIKRNSCHIDIQKAYKRLVLKWHPTKHPVDQQTALNNFHEISEAYEVLNNPVTRAYFD